ncbi:ribulose-phosphate 3-epimerase [Candidatus Peregrinibacteria bacterium]|nr:ribulose-phosphate 3-epimerase [Candidatus Peregrinibacteria bacterium]
MARKILITPSILSADFARLQEEVESVEPYADWLQVDVMDGHFVPNLSFGAPVLKSLKTKLPLDVHLMVENPAERIDEFLALKVRHITFHAEVVAGTKARKDLINRIHKGGASAGIALNPETPIDDIADVLADIDLLLVMSVQPGFGGQKFLPEVLSKVRQARKEYPKLMIQMDGGIDATTAKMCIEAGADNLVSGSFIFRSSDRTMAIASLRPS